MAKIIETLDLDALRDGDKVFNDLYHNPKLKRILYLYALNITRDEMKAEEAVQLAFLYLYRAKHKIKSARHLQNYLYQAVRHKSLNPKKAGLSITLIDPDELAEKTASMDLSADTRIMQAEIAVEGSLDSIYSNLHLVSDLGASLIRLRFQQDLTIDQIASQLNLSKKQVSRNLNKALAILKKKLTGNGSDKSNGIYLWLTLLWILVAFILKYFYSYGDIWFYPGTNWVGITTDEPIILKLLHG